jgi:excisionase family DNA binding protein
MKKFFSTTELARICQISRYTASKWAREGKVRGTSLGRNYKIPAEEIIRLLTEHNCPVPDELKTENRHHSGPQTYCWTYHLGKDTSRLHQCDGCLIKRANILNCFVMRIDDYQDKIKCNIHCSECKYFLYQFADHFAIIEEFEEAAIICSHGSILAANHEFVRISRVENEENIVDYRLSDFLTDLSKTRFSAYKGRVREDDPLRPEYIDVFFVDAQGETKDVQLLCKRLKNIPDTFLIFFKC